MNASLLSVGQSVVTNDDHMIGHVSVVAGDCFKIDRPMAPDEWLGMDVISGIQEDNVHLNVSLEELDDTPHGEDLAHMGFHVHHGP